MSVSEYRQAVRSAVRGYWTGALTAGDFRDQMQSAIDRQLTIAFREGAAKCDIQPNEFTAEETAASDQFIIEQFGFISGFALAIDQNSRANGGKLTPLLNRADRWVSQYEKVVSNGQAIACSNQKMEFVLGPTEKHCRTCLGLNGRVYRNSVWVANGAVPPKNGRFECGAASFCVCRLVETSRPITKGRFPTSLLV